MTEKLLGFGDLHWHHNFGGGCVERHCTIGDTKLYDGRAPWLADFNTELDEAYRDVRNMNYMFFRTSEQIIYIRDACLSTDGNGTLVSYYQSELLTKDTLFFCGITLEKSYSSLDVILVWCTSNFRIHLGTARIENISCVDIKSNQLTTRIYL
ncbi:MAG: hypothetical protein K0U41_07070 [Gammaproteobacteria bacterium]|nr:hypothetical protein [Gammaproteobacteria bacterium]